MKSFLSILFLFIFGVPLAFSDLTQEAQDLAAKWAPLVWLHPDEQFFPSNIDFFLDQMEMRDEDENMVQAHPTPSNILRGEMTNSYHLNTFEELECVRCTRPHFYGQPLEIVTVNALIKEHADDCNTVDVSYPFFYPYNYGKDVCIGADPGGFCLGAKPTFGNHVSDWEHCTIRFQNGLPIKMKLAVHSFESYYAFDAETNTFLFESGSDFELGGTTFPIEYPEIIQLVEDTHPEVFSANGSHGTWGGPGKHNYLTFLIHLDDFTERGTAWKTWENIHFLDANMSDSGFSGNYSWVDFQGRWGNSKKMHCEVEAIVGECGITPGVGGPGSDFGLSGLGDIPECTI